MKPQFGLIRRPWIVFYLKNKTPGEQTSLTTCEKQEAQRLLQVHNESESQPHFNLALARVYINGADPKLITRTWQEVMEHIVTKKTDQTRRRWETAIKDANFDCIRKLCVAETRPEQFDKALADGKLTVVSMSRIQGSSSAPAMLSSSSARNQFSPAASGEPFEGRAHGVFADGARHPQQAGIDAVPAHAVDVGITPVPAEHAQEHRAQHVEGTAATVAGVVQRAALQELEKRPVVPPDWSVTGYPTRRRTGRPECPAARTPPPDWHSLNAHPPSEPTVAPRSHSCSCLCLTSRKIATLSFTLLVLVMLEDPLASVPFR
jgi:hypothetical protein